MNQENIQRMFDHIGGFVYSTKETQKHSFDMGKYVVDNNIKGDIIECGVASGGNFASMMLGAISNSIGKERIFWGFDSFQGIQLAGKKDDVQAGIGAITHDVNVPEEQLLISSGITVHPKQQVIDHLTSWGLIPELKINLIEGWVQNSIPTVIDNIKEISILRLDMDVYEPTKFTLEKLYPLVSKGGVIIIDDWALNGVRISVEEYLKENNIEVEILTIENSTPTYFYKP